MKSNIQETTQLSKEEYYTLFLDRTIRMLGEDAIQAIKTKRVAIAGCGGVGGAACITLARMGIQNFTISDPGIFDEPDINRQFGAYHENLNKNKADVYERFIKEVNPYAEVKSMPEGVTEDNIEELLAGADLLIDSLDIAVPQDLRGKMYKEAALRKLPMIISPILGFGGMVIASEPGGMPLTEFGQILNKAVSSGKIPDVLWKTFKPEHLVSLGHALLEFKAPSVAPAAMVSASILCTEVLLILGGKAIPGWRPPVILPKLTLVDLFNQNIKVIDILELKQEESSTEIKNTNKKEKTSPKPVKTPEKGQKGIDYEFELSKVGNNVNLLSHQVVDIDMMTDSWRELDFGVDESDALAEGEGKLNDYLRNTYPFKYILPVFRGRFAESLVCKALIKTGVQVVHNGLFPTARYHIETSGGKLIYGGADNAGEPGNHFSFKGNLDIKKLKSAVEKDKNSIVYIELANNSYYGSSISMSNLKEIKTLCLENGIKLVIDMTRAFENAYWISQNEEGYGDIPIQEIVNEISSICDLSIVSLPKDFKCREGAFIGTSDNDLYFQLLDLVTLAFGSGLTNKQEQEIKDALENGKDLLSEMKSRTQLTEEFGRILKKYDIPVILPLSGYAIYVDAGAYLSHIPDDQHPAPAFVNGLYKAGGVRAGVSYIGKEQMESGLQIVRLAIPVRSSYESKINHFEDTIKIFSNRKDSIKGMKKVGAPPGMVGEFIARYSEL